MGKCLLAAWEIVPRGLLIGLMLVTGVLKLLDHDGAQTLFIGLLEIAIAGILASRWHVSGYFCVLTIASLGMILAITKPGESCSCLGSSVSASPLEHIVLSGTTILCVLWGLLKAMDRLPAERSV
jgi:hypothetical protein